MMMCNNRDQEFPSLGRMTYLNTAAEGIPPRSVNEAMLQYTRDKAEGMDGRSRHEAQWEAAKQQVAIAYGLSADEVGICSCSSEAYNLAASALQLQPGDEVIINDLDFPAGTTPWLHDGCPAKVKLWRSREGALRVEDLVSLLSARTRLVTTSLVSFFNGFKLNLAAIADAVRKHSPALLALDVTQALGRIPMDLSEADLIISSTHKWILASHGGGLVGVPRHRAQTWTAAVGGWFNRANAFEADRFEHAPAKIGAASFTVGMPNYPAVYAIRAALQYIHETGVKHIDVHCRPLVQACMDGLKRLPVKLITPDESDALAGIIAFRHPDAERLHAALHAQNIHIMSQAGRLRVAIHGYNTMDDVQHLLRNLEGALRHD